MPPTPATANPSRAAALWRSRTRRDQVFFATLAIIFLGISALIQNSLSSARTGWNLVREAPDSEKSYRALAVNFPRFTLGGFRGILSTILWQQAEDDKNNRKWLELETKYDIIGALQPYFVSVYVFHAWNQAYNLSAQWQEEDTKYKWILDGLAYLYKGEDYNPGHTDLFLEQGHLYFMKLGGAYERTYFRAHWRDDLARLHELNNAKDISSDATVALRHVRDFVNRPDSRDRNNHYFHVTELGDPDQKAPKSETGWGIEITPDPNTSLTTRTTHELFKYRADGKKPEEPIQFRHGVSVFYFGHCEYLRCLNGGGPSMTSLTVLDAWPAMSLRLWCRDDTYYSYQSMNALFGKNPNMTLLESPEKFRDKVNEINDCYRNIAMIGPRAIDLFSEHLSHYPRNEGIHRKHILETQAFMAVAKAESKLFNTLVAWHLNKRQLDEKLKRDLLDTIPLYEEASRVTMIWVDKVYPAVIGEIANPDRADAEKYALALQTRSKGIQKWLTLPPTEAPDMSFFEEETCEK